MTDEELTAIETNVDVSAAEVHALVAEVRRTRGLLHEALVQLRDARAEAEE